MKRNRPRLGLTLYAAGVLLALSTGQGIGATKAAPKTELNELRQRIEQFKRDIESAEENKADVLDGLKQSEQSISTINRSLHDLSQQRAQAATELSGAQTLSAQTRARILAQQAILAKLLYQQYVNGGQDAMRLVLNLQNPNDIARQTEYYGYLSRSRASLIADLRQDLQVAEAAEEVVRDKHSELMHIQAQQLKEKRDLQNEAQTRKTALSKLEKQIDARRKQVAQMERDEKRLTALVERLARLAVPKLKPPKRVGPRPGTESDFSKLKGHLLLPVTGELTNRFGSARKDSGTAWKGLFIRAATGSPVKALAPGRVVFADWLRGFGNLIIIDHGDGYMSLYGNNEAVLKHEGDEVKAGEIIASVGNSGGNAESGLYFEVRYQSRPIDPLLWVGRR